MTNTTTETLTVDGVVLNTLAKNVSSLTGRLRAPGLRTPNIVVPGRHGSIRPPNRVYDDNIITLPMWVRGVDDNGAVTTTKRRHFWSNVDQLTQLFGYHKKQLQIQHTLPDGSIRECFADVVSPLEVIVDNYDGEPTGLVTVELTLDEPFWQDSADVNQTVTGIPAGTTSLANFAGATALMDDLLIRWTGPITNPTLTSVYNSVVQSGMYCTYQGTIGAGQYLEFDCNTWTFTASGFTFNYANWAHSGAARFYTLYPGLSAGTPQYNFTGTGTSASTAIKFTGRRKYLVG